MPQKLKHLGVPVYIDGQNYYIPSLTVQDFRANYDALTKTPDTTNGPFEYWDKLIPVIGLAIRRNYPEITDEWLAENLDLNTIKLAIEAVSASSKLTPVTEGE
jgi:hypothetical protein